MFEIPLAGGAKNVHQTFTAILGEKEIEFKLDFLAYTENPSWNLTLSKDGEILVEGLLLRCGCDLLAPYQLGIGKLVMIGEEPTAENLGVLNTLVWVAENETL